MDLSKALLDKPKEDSSSPTSFLDQPYASRSWEFTEAGHEGSKPPIIVGPQHLVL